jgi:hypothetical protein
MENKNCRTGPITPDSEPPARPRRPVRLVFHRIGNCWIPPRHDSDMEALQRFVEREPLRRVHDCVFGALALESEPVDPRL